MEKDSDFSDSEYDHFVKSQLELMKENEVSFKVNLDWNWQWRLRKFNDSGNGRKSNYIVYLI